MEKILDLYQLPYDPEIPLICEDEKPIQLLKGKRESIPAEPGKPERGDYEYERGGVVNAFILTEPLKGRRFVSIRDRNTKLDWAEEIKDLLEECYPEAKRVRLVCDNLKTHSFGALYDAFPPEKAHELASRLEIHYTPKHGSWLNIAEIELHALSKQCLDRRIPDKATLVKETSCWEERRNGEQKGVDWQFTTSDARVRLKRLYPQS